jgi:glycosyltransferase involved in cell wall biosynthesis
MGSRVMRRCAVMTGSGPTVCVVTPVYNGAEYIQQCIESVLAQTFTDFEYIIVNNCSTDDTLAIARRCAARDSRIKVHDNTDFLGVIENHNLAFSLMSPGAKYCKVVSADDFVFPGCLEQMVSFAVANPSVGIVGCYELRDKEVRSAGLPYESRVVSGREVCRETLLGNLYVFGAPTGLLYSADLMRRNAPFYPNSNPHADASACYKVLVDCDFGFVHQVLAYTRVHPNSQTSQSLKVGKFIHSYIADLARYGHFYLTGEQIATRKALLMSWYYSWLVRRIYERWGDKQFWELQKKGLHDVGIKFSATRLWATAALRLVKEFGSSPRVALGRVMGLKKAG